MAGPHEHHSNLLPWREVATVVNIPEDFTGRTDQEALQRALAAHTAPGTTLVGCFSAASNVTGVLEDNLGATSVLY